MCGRFSLTQTAEVIIEHFSLKQGLYMKPRYNVAPGESIPIIRTLGVVDFLQWGFKPSWMEETKAGTGFINVRAETVQIRPAFRDALKKRRCLIILDGYYEWKTIGRLKQPYYIRRKEGAVFAAAGIWENDSCGILTTVANSLLSPIHPRMPLILEKETYQKWLDAKSPIKEIIEIVLTPPSSLPFLSYPVTPKVNNPRFEGLECIQSLQ